MEEGPTGLASKMPGQKRDSEQLELRQRLCPPVLTGVDCFVPQNLGWKSRISPYSVFQKVSPCQLLNGLGTSPTWERDPHC